MRCRNLYLGKSVKVLVQVKTLKQLFLRYRRPGNLFFAVLFLALSLSLFLNLQNQTQWQSGTKWSSQPALWPMISIYGMVFFATLNWISAFVSPKIEGRWQEVLYWVKAIEYVGWFMAYVLAVPTIGYLPSTIIFCVLLCLRAGYRSWRMVLYSTIIAVLIVVLFKSFLQVKVPGGQLYELLPDAIRSFFLTYL